MESQVEIKQVSKSLGVMDVTVALEVIHHGIKSQPLKVQHAQPTDDCKTCLGKAQQPIKCDKCSATGESFERILDQGVIALKSLKCPDCQGTGMTTKPCADCTKVYEFDFSLERGFPTNGIQRFEVKDHSTSMNLRIKPSAHPRYQRVMDAPQHLVAVHVISLEQAVGLKPFEFELPHINGDPKYTLKFRSEPGKIYRDGDVHRFVGQGLPVYRTESSHGDCLVLFQVEFPTLEWFQKPGRMEQWKKLFE